MESEIERLDDVYVYTIDDLGKVVSQGMASRQAAITQAQTIIDLRVSDFAGWLRQRQTVPAIHFVTCTMVTHPKKCWKCSLVV